MQESRVDYLWIGGAACSGKSLLADEIAREHGLPVYHADDRFNHHGAAALPGSTLHRIHRWSPEQIFMRPVEEMLEDNIQVYREEFSMILKELEGPEWSAGAVVEGCALLPENLASIGAAGRRAVFLVATESFQRAYYETREWIHDVLRQTSEPATAWENWRSRDAGFARYVIAEAERYGYPVVTVDETRSPADVAAEARAHLTR